VSRETFVTVIANLVDVYERERRLMAPFERIPVAPTNSEGFSEPHPDHRQSSKTRSDRFRRTVPGERGQHLGVPVNDPLGDPVQRRRPRAPTRSDPGAGV